MGAGGEQLWMRALATYEAQGENELSITEGDDILVLRKDDSGWWEGQNGERVGWFPSNYCAQRYDLYTIAEVDTPRSEESATARSQASYT